MNNYADFLKTTGFGSSDGLGLSGFGCRHLFRAGWEFTKPFHTEAELKELKERELTPKEYEWTDRRGIKHKKGFTLRQALDKQRSMERQMRSSLSDGVGMKAAGNKDGYEEAYSLYRRQLAEYNKFSKAMDIIPQMERVYMAYPGGFHAWKNEWGA